MDQEDDLQSLSLLRELTYLTLHYPTIGMPTYAYKYIFVPRELVV